MTNGEMDIAPADAIASCFLDSELFADCITTSVFDRKVVTAGARREAAKGPHRRMCAERKLKTCGEINLQ